MSVMSSQRRKIAKTHRERLAIIRAAYKPEEWIKHRAHALAILCWMNRLAQGSKE